MIKNLLNDKNDNAADIYHGEEENKEKIEISYSYSSDDSDSDEYFGDDEVRFHPRTIDTSDDMFKNINK